MLKTVLLTIGVLALLEGIVIALFPKAIGKELNKFSKKKKLLELAAIEIIASLILIAIGFTLN